MCLACGIPLPSEGWWTPPAIWAGRSFQRPTGTPCLDFHHISVLNIACVHMFTCSHHWFSHGESSPNIDCWVKVYLEIIIISLFIFVFLLLLKSPGHSLNQRDKQFGDLLLTSTMSFRKSTLSAAWTSWSLNWSKARCVCSFGWTLTTHLLFICTLNVFSSLLLQEFLEKAEAYSVEADLLLGKAADIQLDTKNETLMQDAQSTREAVTQLQDRLNEQYDRSLLSLNYKIQ